MFYDNIDLTVYFVFLLIAFCFLCLLHDTNDDLASIMQSSGNPGRVK